MREIKMKYEDESNGINYNKEEYDLFHKKILEISNNQSKEEKIKNLLVAMKFNMEDYIKNTNPDKIILVGDFLKKILNELNIQSKTFAEYLDLKPSNFSSLIKGQRKLNIDLAIKLGNIFNTSPDIWATIEIKNEVLKAKKNRYTEFEKYKLQDII